MKKSFGLFLGCFALFISLCAFGEEMRSSPVAGVFDSYVLAMTYANDFCVANPSKKECHNGAGAAGMVLHGLWPNVNDDPKHMYQYCSQIKKEHLGKEWCTPALDVHSQMREPTFSALSKIMPGVMSCLYNHEWYAHGTCSAMTVEDYFDKSQKLAHQFAALPQFQTLVAASAGKTVSRDQLLNALIADLGSTAADSVVVYCRKGRTEANRAYLSEVHVTLDRQELMKFPDPKSLGRSNPYIGPDQKPVKDIGNCPAGGIIVSPAS